MRASPSASIRTIRRCAGAKPKYHGPLRAQNKPTIPSTMGEERAANPFLRADDPALAAAVGLPDAPPAEVFGEIRRRKDNFR